MTEHLNIAAFAVFVVLIVAAGAWLSRNHPSRVLRTVSAVMSTIIATLGSADIGNKISNGRGYWMTNQGYSCGETKILGLILIIGAAFLVRAIWQSLRSEEGSFSRAAKLALACLGLSLTGFTLSESDKAHDRFHQIHYPSEAHP